MKNIFSLGIIIIGLLLLPAPGTATTPSTLPLIQKNDLTYLGAFRLPAAATDEAGFAYGGTAIAFHAANQSLFVVGHDWHQRVGEVKIPTIKNGSSISDLATGTLLQPLADPTDGKISQVDVDTIKVGGLLVYDNKLINTEYSYYDGDANATLSHIVTSLELSKKGDAQGPYKVGTVGAGFVSGYMDTIPAVWQPSFGGPALTGQCCIAIISRSSFGPAVSVFNPSDLGSKNPVPATALLYYPDNHTTLGAWDGNNTQFNGTTQIRGIAFPDNSRSVLFIGNQGIGKFCYGTGSECHDLANESKGTHGYPYAYQIWAYDANDLLAVKDGQKQPWDIRPYAVWNFELPFTGKNDSHELGGAAYDHATGRLFISQKYGDGAQPIIHVFRIGTWSGDTTPPPAQAPEAPPVTTPNPTTPSPVTPPKETTPAPVAPQPTECFGLNAIYYNNKNFSGKKITRIDPFINFHWGAGTPNAAIDPDTFSVRWKGFIIPRYSETYTFTTYSDDGAKLYVNGKLVVNRWRDQGATEASGKITLKAGKKYAIRLDYYENSGWADAELRWESQSQAKETITSSSLRCQ